MDTNLFLSQNPCDHELGMILYRSQSVELLTQKFWEAIDGKIEDCYAVLDYAFWLVRIVGRVQTNSIVDYAHMMNLGTRRFNSNCRSNRRRIHDLSIEMGVMFDLKLMSFCAMGKYFSISFDRDFCANSKETMRKRIYDNFCRGYLTFDL